MRTVMAILVVMNLTCTAAAGRDLDGDGGFPLVVDHSTEAVVVPPPGDLGANGHDLERLALNDFREYIEKSTGARPAVADRPAKVPANQPLVVLGIAGRDMDAAPLAAPVPLKRHAFYYCATSRRLTIIGADPRGLANGVHWLLRNKLGVRWYMPTELGEVVPKHASVTLEPQQVTVSPEFDWIRFTGNINELPDEVLWGVRHGDDLWDEEFRHHWHFQKHWAALLPPTKENVENHPEWWAREEGKLPVYHDELNVCVSNPEVIQKFSEAARQFFDAEPDRVMLSLESNDSPEYCRCRSCQNLLASLGPDATQSDMYIHFCNRVIAAVRKTHPDKLYGFYGYQSYGDHTNPPRRVKPDPSLRVLLTRYGDKVCNRHWLEDPRCQVNPKWRESFEKWSLALGNCGVYDYWAGYQWFGPEPHTRLAKDLPFLKKHGAQYVCSESGYSWGTMGPFYYQTARLLQDTSLDSGSLIDEFCRGMYGPAYAPMRRYWQRWIDAFDGGPDCETEVDRSRYPAHISWHIYRYHYDQVYTPDLIAAAYRDIEEALRLVESAPEQYRLRIQMAQFGLRYTDAILRMFRQITAGDTMQALAAAEQAIDVIKESRSLPGPDTFETKSINAATRVLIESRHLERGIER